MISVDIETSGLNPQLSDMVSLGAVELESGNEFYEECRVLPRAVISEKACEVNGFSAEEMRDEKKPLPFLILEDFIVWAEQFEDRTLMGQNIGSFDVQFLKKYVSMVGYQGPDWCFGYRYLDLHSMVYIITGKSMGISDACDYFKVEKEPDPHHALEGARMSLRLYKRLQSMLHDHAADNYGNSIVTFTGHRINFIDPDPREINIIDIAHGLSNNCRFAGQCDKFFSVGQHSINVASILDRDGEDPDIVLQGLLHDATEAYLPDLAAPAKKQVPDFQRMEKKLSIAISEALDVDITDLHEKVQEADKLCLYYEANNLFKDEYVDWADNVNHAYFKEMRTRKSSLHVLSPTYTEAAFLDMYYDLVAKDPLTII